MRKIHFYIKLSEQKNLSCQTLFVIHISAIYLFCYFVVIRHHLSNIGLRQLLWMVFPSGYLIFSLAINQDTFVSKIYNNKFVGWINIYSFDIFLLHYFLLECYKTKIMYKIEPKFTLLSILIIMIMCISISIVVKGGLKKLGDFYGIRGELIEN